MWDGNLARGSSFHTRRDHGIRRRFLPPTREASPLAPPEMADWTLANFGRSMTANPRQALLLRESRNPDKGGRAFSPQSQSGPINRVVLGAPGNFPPMLCQLRAESPTSFIGTQPVRCCKAEHLGICGYPHLGRELSPFTLRIHLAFRAQDLDDPAWPKETWRTLQMDSASRSNSRKSDRFAPTFPLTLGRCQCPLSSRQSR
jgi:hypothetical protein